MNTLIIAIVITILAVGCAYYTAGPLLILLGLALHRAIKAGWFRHLEPLENAAWAVKRFTYKHRFLVVVGLVAASFAVGWWLR